MKAFRNRGRKTKKKKAEEEDKEIFFKFFTIWLLKFYFIFDETMRCFE